MQNRNRRIVLSLIISSAIIVPSIWIIKNYTCICDRFKTYDPPSDELMALLGDFTTALMCLYGTTDNLGRDLDCLNIFEYLPGQYYGVHHSYNGTSFSVHLVNSTDLVTWNFICILAFEASMPVIEYLPQTGDFYLAHEQWQNPNTTGPCWIKFRYYPSLLNLINGTATRVFQTSKSLSDFEGTPSFYSIQNGGNVIQIGLHFNGPDGLDRVANGTLFGLHSTTPSWNVVDWKEYNEKLVCKGIEGHIGGRDKGVFWGTTYSVQEAQVTRDDWSAWRSYLYNWADGGFWSLDIKTDGGSISLSNPHFKVVHNPLDFTRYVIFGSYFILGEGAATGESGECIFYKSYEP